MSKAFVSYPADLFTSEKILTTYFERFASHALHRGIMMLRDKKLPDTLSIDLSDDEEERLYINIGPDPDLILGGKIGGFKIKTSAYYPPILAATCHVFSKTFEELDQYEQTPYGLLPVIINFGKHLDEASKASKKEKEQLPIFIRVLYERIGLSSYTMHERFTYFDSCSDFLACHEIAHAYAGQFTDLRRLSAEDSRFTYKWGNIKFAMWGTLSSFATAIFSTILLLPVFSLK